MTPPTASQLLDLHNRAKHLADGLHRFTEDAESYGLPFVALRIYASELDDWRKNHMYKALGEAVAKEHNRS